VVDHLFVVGQPGQGESGLRDRIEWAVGFRDEGSVILYARAENYGTMPAQVLAPGATTWADPDPMFFNMFTITTVMVDNSIGAPLTFPIVLPPEETFDVRITLAWDGDIPIGGFGDSSPIAPFVSGSNWHTDYWHQDLITGNPDYDWANSFIFSLIYQVAP
jgi:hypothetical protein